jgi:hypothetical protein
MRRFLRLGLRGALILILLIAAWLAWLVQQARVQRRAVTAVESCGGRVWYDWQRNSLTDFMPDRGEPPHWPTWIIDQFGIDLFGHVIKVELRRETFSDEVLANVGELNRLEDLAILDSGSATDRGYAHLEQLVCLRRLELHDSNLTNRGLSHVARLISLEELDLSLCTGITDVGFVQLNSLRNLRTLVLERTGLTDDGLAGIQALSNLRTLYVNYDAVGDAGLARIGGLARLERLAAHGCASITDDGLARVAKLSRLEFLALSGTRVSDSGMKHLAGLRRLKKLNVSNTRVTEVGERELQIALPKLDINNPPASDAFGARLFP